MTLEQYLELNPKKHLIFDIDNTLAALKIDWTNVYQFHFEEIKKINSSLISTPTTSSKEFYLIINQAVEKYGEDAKKKTVQFMTQFECKSYSGYLPNNELLSFIRSHADTYIFSLWTSNTERVISDFIQKEGLRPIFQNIISLNTVHYSKPYPDGFYKIYNASFSKKDYLMIGDSDNDESAAKAAGIDFFKVDYFDRQ